VQSDRTHQGMHVTYRVTCGSDQSSPANTTKEGCRRAPPAHRCSTPTTGSFLPSIDVTHYVTMPMIARTEEDTPPDGRCNVLRYNRAGRAATVCNALRYIFWRRARTPAGSRRPRGCQARMPCER
jgi:hypothetical protein